MEGARKKRRSVFRASFFYLAAFLAFLAALALALAFFCLLLKAWRA